MNASSSGSSSKEASRPNYLEAAHNVTGVIYSIGKFMFYGAEIVGGDVVRAVRPRAISLATDLAVRMIIGPKPEPAQIQEPQDFQDRLRPISLEELSTK